MPDSRTEDLGKSIDRIINKAIDQEFMTGAVVLIGQHDRVLYKQAYGYAYQYSSPGIQAESKELMTVGHVFDLASLSF